jgi:prepilin signal peptidase PulO-like enzyme (type II secretory pathway)
LNTAERLTLIALDIVFLAAAAVAALLGRLPPIPDWAFLPILGLAAFRGGRAIAYNFVFKWLREMAHIREVEDTSGAGMSNEATGTGIQHAIGELLCCPICSGTWVGVSLLLAYAFLPPLGEALMYALAAAGVAEVLDWLSDFFSWKARAAREDAGTQWLRKNRGQG